MTITAKENNGGASGFFEELNGAIRENPVSAGFLGLGILWMFFGTAKIASFAGALPGTTRYVTDGLRSTSQGERAAAAGMSGKVGEVVRDASETIKLDGQEAVATVSSAGRYASRAATEYGRDIGQSVQKNVAFTLEKQPLLLGAIGVGIGAGIASMFPSTTLEQELVGSTATKVKHQLGDIASQAEQRVEQVFDEVKREVTEKGLTAASANEGLKNVGEKVRATTVAAKESILTVR